MNRDEQIHYIADCLHEAIGDIGVDPDLLMPRTVGTSAETVAHYIARACLQSIHQWADMLVDFGPEES